MGVYLDAEPPGGLFDFEALRQKAVDQSRPVRFRGNHELEHSVRLAAAFYDTAVSAISIIDRDQQVFVARTGIEIWGTPRTDSLCAIAIQRPGEPLIVPDAREDPRFARMPSVIAPPRIRFYAGITIVDRSGYPLGALCVFDDKPRFAETDTTMLSHLARGIERIVCR